MNYYQVEVTKVGTVKVLESVEIHGPTPHSGDTICFGVHRIIVRAVVHVTTWGESKRGESVPVVMAMVGEPLFTELSRLWQFKKP